MMRNTRTLRFYPKNFSVLFILWLSSMFTAYSGENEKSSLKFTGASGGHQRLVLKSEEKFGPGEKGTVECWFKTLKNNKYNGILLKGDFSSGKGKFDYYIMVSKSNFLSAALCQGKRELALSSKKTNKIVSPGIWHHAALVWDGKNAKLFLDGRLADCAKMTFRIEKQREFPLIFGGWNNAFPSDVQIDELRISDIPRYEGDFEAGRKAFKDDADTKVHYSFDRNNQESGENGIDTNLLSGEDFTSAQKVNEVKLDWKHLKGKNPLLGKRFPLMEIPCCKKPPEIDGENMDISWTGVSPVKMKIAGDGRRADIDTDIYCCHDDKNIYLYIFCHEPQTSRIVSKVRERDKTDIWRDDSIEIFLQRIEKGAPYYWIAVNSAGAFADIEFIDPAQGDTMWDSKIEVKSFIRENSGWGIEMAIPLASIGVEVCGKDLELYGNFARHRWSQGIRSTYAYAVTGGALHAPDKFARFLLSPESEAENKSMEAEDKAASAKRANLQGCVVNKKGPVSFIKVFAADAYALTDENGFFNLIGLPSGKKIGLVLWADDYSAIKAEMDLKPGDNSVGTVEMTPKNPQRYSNSIKAFGENFRVCRQAYLDTFMPNSKLPENKNSGKLEFSAAKGESISESFVVLANPEKDLKNLIIECSGLSPAGQGRTIPEENIRIEKIDVVFQRLSFFSSPLDLAEVPLFLHKAEKECIEKHCFKQYLVTIRIPEDVSAGSYKGTIRFSVAGNEENILPLSLKIYPFELEKKSIPAVGFFPKITPDASIIKSWKEHCLNTTVIFCSAVLKKTAKGYEADFSRLISDLEEFKQNGFTGPFPFAYGIRGLSENSPDFEKLYVETAEKILKTIKEKNLPEVYFFPVDEPFGRKRQMFLKMAGLLKKVPGAKIFVTYVIEKFVRDRELFEAADVIATGSDIGVLADLEKIRKILADNNKQLWLYSNSAFYGAKDAMRARLIFGFYLWYSEAHGQVPWVFTTNPKNSFPYNPRKGVYGTSCGYVFLPKGKHELKAPYNFVKALKYEGAREGVNDLRYIYTLLRLMEKCKDPALKKKSEQTLDKIRKRLKRNSGIEGNLRKLKQEDFENFRKAIAERIMEIRNSLKN